MDHSSSQRLTEVAALFLKLGMTAFGGPAAHIAMMHDETVKRRKWLECQATPDSEALRAGLATGRFEFAHAAVDNAVAMAEMAGADVVIVLGGDSGMNELVAQPAIRTVADLRGKTVIERALAASGR